MFRHPRVRARVARLGVVLALTGIALIPVTRAHAYALLGIYPPTYFGFGYSEGSFASSADRSAIEYGASAWSNSPAPITFQLSGTNYHVNTSSSNAGNTGWDGITGGWQYTGNTCSNGFSQLQMATLVLNHTYTQSESTAQIEHVATHELGHVIGLDHSTDSNAIMYNNGYNHTTPQTDDVNGVQDIYNHC